MAGNRHQAAAVHELERHGRQCFRLNRYLRQIHQLDAEQFRQSGQNILFFGEAAFDEKFVERLVRGGGPSLLQPGNVVRGKYFLLGQIVRKLHGYLSSDVRV